MRKSFCVPRKRDAPDQPVPKTEKRNENACPNKSAWGKSGTFPVDVKPLLVSSAEKSAACADKAFKALYTQRSNKRRKNKSWAGECYVPVSASTSESDSS